MSKYPLISLPLPAPSRRQYITLPIGVNPERHHG